MLTRMGEEMKADLHEYLRTARQAMLWKLDGLSEYDMRRPMTPTGTNLLGLVKHLTAVEAGYFGLTFGRPYPEVIPWMADDAELNSDMWATETESSSGLIDLYVRVLAHSDHTIDELAFNASGTVPHWPTGKAKVTLHRILVHVTTETYRHAGHADIVRELVDGAVGLRPDSGNMASDEQAWWPQYLDRVEHAARVAGRID